MSASARTRILAGESEAGRSARACQAGCKIWPPWPDMHRTVSRQLPVARYAAQSCRGAGMRLAAGRALGRKAIRCMAGGSYRMLSPDSGTRPRAAVELLGKLSFNVEAQGRCAALSRSVPWSAVLGRLGSLGDSSIRCFSLHGCKLLVATLGKVFFSPFVALEGRDKPECEIPSGKNQIYECLCSTLT